MLTALLLCCLMLGWLSRRSGSKFEPPSYPGGLPIIGHLHRALYPDNLYEELKAATALVQQSGWETFTVKFGPIKTYVVSDPDDCLKVANTCLNKYYIHYFLKNWVGSGLFTANADIWKRDRKLLFPAFSTSVINQFIPIFNEKSKTFVFAIGSQVRNGPFEPDRFLMELVMSTTCSTTLNFKSKTTIDEKYMHNIEVIFDTYLQRFQRFWLHTDFLYKLSALWRKEKELVNMNTEIAKDAMRKRKLELLHAMKDDEINDDSGNVIIIICEIGRRYLFKTVHEHTNALEDIFKILDSKRFGTNMNGEFIANLRFADDMVFDLPMISQYDEVLNMNMYKTKIMSNTNVAPVPVIIGNDTLGDVDHYVYFIQPVQLGNKNKPLLDLLLQLQETQGIYTDEELVHQLSTGIVASYDTLYKSFLFTLLMIGSHSNVQDRIYKEIQETFDDMTRDVDKDDLIKLVYMEAAIKETLRLYPLAPYLPRTSAEKVQLKKYTIPANSQIIILSYALNRHPRWGPDANEYRPERWLEPGGVHENPNTFSIFGTGKRNCIGKRYAMMMMKTTLVHLLRQYRITGDVSKLKLKVHSMLAPASGHDISLEKRQ